VFITILGSMVNINWVWVVCGCLGGGGGNLPIRGRFPSLFEDVVLGSLKSFVSIRPSSSHQPLSHGDYCIPPLYKISWFETILMYFQSHSPFQLPSSVRFISMPTCRGCSPKITLSFSFSFRCLVCYFEAAAMG